MICVPWAEMGEGMKVLCQAPESSKGERWEEVGEWRQAQEGLNLQWDLLGLCLCTLPAQGGDEASFLRAASWVGSSANASTDLVVVAGVWALWWLPSWIHLQTGSLG